MESISKIIKIKIIASVAFYILFSLTSLVVGQSLPQVSARFANPQYLSGKGLYFLDVELSSANTPELLFGINVRFFYESSKLTFKDFDQFYDGYGLLGGLPQMLQNNDQYGGQMFNWKGATAYVNGSVQIQNLDSPLKIVPGKWTKVFRVSFSVSTSSTNGKEFCPSLVWDIKPAVGGGFLIGDDGLVITIIDDDPNTPDDSAPTRVTGINFNWDPNTGHGTPYGKPSAKNCINIGKIGTREDVSALNEFALFQNEPNPFNRGTVIEFVIPASQEVTLKFYDVSGKDLFEIKGDYKAGRNTINLDSQPWMVGSKVIFYRMETEGFRSKMMKMAIVNE